MSTATTTSFQRSLLPPAELDYENMEVPLDDLPPDERLPSPRPQGAMVESMEYMGLLQPILVGRAADGGLAVWDGRRRVKAARILGWDTIPAQVYAPGTDYRSVIAILANETRSPNVISDLQAIEDLINEGYEVDDIARQTGMGKKTIESRMVLTSLHPDLRVAFEAGRISASVAVECAKCSPDIQAELACEYEDKKKLTARAVREIKSVARGEATRQISMDIFSTPSVEPAPASPSFEPTAPADPMPFVEALEKEVEAAHTELAETAVERDALLELTTDLLQVMPRWMWERHPKVKEALDRLDSFIHAEEEPDSES